MSGRIYGYLRGAKVSEITKKADCLTEAGVPAGDVFADIKVREGAAEPSIPGHVYPMANGSPSPGELRAFRGLLNRLEPGDTVIICGLNDLGCSAAQILSSLEQICAENEAVIRVLSLEKDVASEMHSSSGNHIDSNRDATEDITPEMPLSNEKDALLKSDFILQVLREVVGAERTFRRKQQAEGIAEARDKGIRFGRPSKALPDNYFHEYQKWRKGKTTIAEAAKACGMTPARFYYQAKKFRKSAGI